MLVYLAGERELISADSKYNWSRVLRRKLFSYYYHGAKLDNKPTKEIYETLSVTKDLFLDSGAFSAFTKGAELDIDSYAEYIHEADIWTCISNLDDIRGNSQLTYDNQKALESLGCKVCPVYHSREDPKWLQKYLDEGYEYIFIGGMVPESTKFLLGWLDDIWEHYLINPDGTPRVKVHGFGLTTVDLMFRYPWYSVDSSTWLMTGIFGNCIMRIDGKYINIPMSKDSPRARDLNSRHYLNLNKHEKDIIDSHLTDLGITAEDCMFSYQYRDIVNADTFQNMELYGTDRFIVQQRGLFDV